MSNSVPAERSQISGQAAMPRREKAESRVFHLFESSQEVCFIAQVVVEPGGSRVQIGAVAYRLEESVKAGTENAPFIHAGLGLGLRQWWGNRRRGPLPALSGTRCWQQG